MPAPIADIDVHLSGVAAADVADAEAALARLAHGSAALPSLDAPARRLLRSEAIASSWIEALHVSHRRLAEAEHGAPGGRYDEARRVLGNVRALAEAVDVGARTDPITVDDLLSMHGALMSTSNVEEDRIRAGKLRDGPVFIGGTNPTNAEYVAPPHDKVDVLLDDLVDFVNHRRDLSPLSIAFARPEASYVAGLNAFRIDDLDAWLTVFAAAVSFAAHATIGLAHEFGLLQRAWNARLVEERARAGERRPRADAAVLAALDILPDMPAFHARDLAERLDRSWRAAQDAVEELVSVGIVKQVSAGKGNRLYKASDVVDLLDGFEHDPDRLAAIRGGPGSPAL